MTVKKKKEKPFQLKDLKDKLKYKYIGKIVLATPYGMLDNKHEYAYTGKEWKNILVYDFSERTTPPFDKMFKEVKK